MFIQGILIYFKKGKYMICEETSWTQYAMIEYITNIMLMHSNLARMNEYE